MVKDVKSDDSDADYSYREILAETTSRRLDPILDRRDKYETKAKELLPELLEQYNPLTVNGAQLDSPPATRKDGTDSSELPELCIEALEEAQPK